MESPRHLQVASSADTTAVELDLRHSRAWDLRIKGLSIHGIAEEMGVAHTTVIRYLNAALDARALPDRVQTLRIELERLDRYQEMLDLAAQDSTPYEVARCVEVMVKLMERRAALLKLDDTLLASTPVFESPSSEVIGLIAAARDRVAAREQQWRGLPAKP